MLPHHKQKAANTDHAAALKHLKTIIVVVERAVEFVDD